VPTGDERERVARLPRGSIHCAYGHGDTWKLIDDGGGDAETAVIPAVFFLFIKRGIALSISQVGFRMPAIRAGGSGVRSGSRPDDKKGGAFLPRLTETQSICLPYPGPSIRQPKHFRLG